MAIEPRRRSAANTAKPKRGENISLGTCTELKRWHRLRPLCEMHHVGERRTEASGPRLT